MRLFYVLKNAVPIWEDCGDLNKADDDNGTGSNQDISQVHFEQEQRLQNKGNTADNKKESSLC